MPKTPLPPTDEAMSQQMADFEFMQEIASRMGEDHPAREAIDPSRVHIVGDRNRQYNWAAWYQGTDQAAADRQTARLREGQPGLLAPDQEIEPDSIYLLPSGMDAETQAHEFMHRYNKQLYTRTGEGAPGTIKSHVKIYVDLAMSADTKGEWEEAVSNFNNFIHREEPRDTKEQREELLRIAEEKLGALVDVASKGT